VFLSRRKARWITSPLIPFNITAMSILEDEKGSALYTNHIETVEKAHQHIDIHEAAARGHVATDEKGNPLVEIDQAASNRLARKVRAGSGA
jgi:hypothetical protein